MITTTIEQKRNSNMQEMGETREPMAMDCWTQAQELAEKYAQKLKHDFWLLCAYKPHVNIPNALVAGWEVIAKRPPKGMVGVLVFKWVHKDKRLIVEAELSLPFDVPISEAEMSSKSSDYTQTVADAAKKSQAILLA